MKRFCLSRYLKIWWPMIALVSCLAGGFFLRYTTRRQTYTAQTVIRYRYAQAAEGLTPSGEPLDAAAVFSPAVVRQAIETLGLSVPADVLRSGGSVTALVPDDIRALQEAQRMRGEEPTPYYPTEYSVQLTLGSAYSAESARTALDEILRCYFAAFCESYLEEAVPPNGAEALAQSDHDYLEQAELLSRSVEETLALLGRCQSARPEFLSTRTGFSFADLADAYQEVRTVDLPDLFAEILGSQLTRNPEVLRKTYQERYDRCLRSGEADQAKLDAVQELLQCYNEKHPDGTAVYDDLLEEYVALLDHQSGSSIEAAYCQYILDAFRTLPEETGDALARQAVEETLSRLCQRLNALHETLSLTLTEYNESRSAASLGVICATTVREKLDVRLYTLLGTAVFFVLSVCAAVLLGRVQELREGAFPGQEE